MALVTLQGNECNTILPWELWDGSDEDIILIQGTAYGYGDKITIYVLDISTDTWSSGQSIGDDGEYRYGANAGQPHSACMRTSDGSIFMIASWQILATGEGTRLFHITSVGQGNVTVTEKAEMVPDVGAANLSYYGQDCSMTIDPTGTKLHAFQMYDETQDTNMELGYYQYDIASNTWESVVQWSENPGMFYVAYVVQQRAITNAGAPLCPLYVNSPDRNWIINIPSSFDIEGGPEPLTTPPINFPPETMSSFSTPAP